MFYFENQNKPSYDPTAPSLGVKTVLNREELDDVVYGAMLSGENPIKKYQEITQEYQQTGNSQFINNLKVQINKDEDVVRRNVILKAIEDPNLPSEIKQQALQNYYRKNELLPSLRNTYAEYIAGLYPKANPDITAFANGFYEKEIAAAQVDKDLNDFGKTLSGSAWEVFAEAAPWLAPVLASNPVTWAIPIAADLRQGYLANTIAQAAQNKDFNTLKDIWNMAFKGEAIKSTREYLKSLPPKEKVLAVKRILATVKELPALDYERYKLVQSFVQAEDYTLLDRAIDDSMLLMDVALNSITSTRKALSTSPKSPLGTTATHNPTEASDIAGTAIADDSEQIAKAFGETHASIIGSLLPKEAEELIHGLNPEATPKLLKILQGLDESGIEAQRLARNELLYSPELRDAAAQKIYDVIKSAKGMAPHLGKSNISSIEQAGEAGDLAFKGKITFGKSADSAFTSYDDALTRAEAYKREKGFEGELTIVKTSLDGKLIPAGNKDSGEFYIQHDWNHTYHPMDLALWGEDAINVSLPILGKRFSVIDKTMTALARSPFGRYIFGNTALSERVTKPAYTAVDKALAIEKDHIIALNRYLAEASPKSRSIVDDLLREGEDLEKAFSIEEVTARIKAKNLSPKEAKEVQEGYYVFRRIADWVYSGVNKMENAKMTRENIRHFKFGDKDIYGVKVSKEVAGTDTVWDVATNTIKQLNPGNAKKGILSDIEQLYKEGGSLVKLYSKVRQGDEVAEYVMMPRGVADNNLPTFVLPYIKGWVPRYAENTYFVTRTPKEVIVNGKKGKPEDFITTHAAANTKKEADKYVEELSKKDPTGIYDVKRERSEERNVLTDAKVYRQDMMTSKHRGKDRLLGADNVDALIGLHRTVKAVSRHMAMDEYLNTFRSTFIQKFGDFSKYQFPTNRGELSAKPNMSLKDSKRLKEAFASFDFYESLLMNSRYDQQLWRNAMIAVSTVAEPFGGAIARLVKDALTTIYPPDILRRMATHLMISLNPQAQRFVQPGQVLVLPAYDPSLFNPNEFRKLTQETLGLKYGINTWRVGSRNTSWIPEDVIITVGSKIAGMSPEEYLQELKDLKATGLVASVDQNTIIEGVFSSAGVPLKEKGILGGAPRKISSAVGTIPAMGRKIGFDSGEQDNLIASWRTARRVLLKKQPELDPNSEYFKALRHANAREMSFGMNRAGTFSYQNNILAMPLQFITAPHKALLSMTTSKLLSPAEKARLFGLYTALYGSYGTVALGAVNWMREQEGDILPPEVWSLVQGGLLDVTANGLINMLMDEKDEHTDLAMSQRFSPLGGTFPFADFLAGLSEDPISQLFMGPSWSLFNDKNGKIPRVLRDIATMWKTEEITPENFDDYLMKATEFTTGGTNWMKYRIAMNTGILVASSGMPVDKQATRMEAIAKLIGVSSKAEVDSWMLQQKFKDSKKEYEDAGKYIHQSIMRRAREREAQGENFTTAFNDSIRHYLSFERDPLIKKAIIDAAKQQNKYMLKDSGQNIESMLYRDAYNRSLEDNKALSNLLRSSTDPRLNQLADKLNKITGAENY